MRIPVTLLVCLLSCNVVYLPLIEAPAPALYLGDKVIAGVPGIAPGDELIVYHISDGILTLEELGDLRYGEIVLGLGTHALQGSDKPYAGHPDLFRLRYGRLLDTALAHGERVVAVGIPWLNWVPEKLPRGERWNGIIAEEAGARGVCVVDLWTSMLTCGMACIADDGYHPSPAGYELMAAAVAACH